MSDEGLLIGGGEPTPTATQGASGIATPTDIVTLTVFGVFENGEAVEQKMTLKLPRHTHHDQAALFVWDQVARLGGLTVKGEKEEYNFYPIPVFKRLALKFGVIAGVGL